MAQLVTNSFIKKYTGKTAARHAGYHKTVDIYNHLRFHVDGYTYNGVDSEDPHTLARQAVNNNDSNPYFEKLIGRYRPGEDAKVMNYRKEIYTSVSSNPCFKVINSLKKIFKSEEFKVSYAESQSPNTIATGESLKDYAEEKYPKGFGSIESWFYTFAFQELIKDPNAVLYTIPLNPFTGDTEFRKPFTKVAHSDRVLEYKSDELIVIESMETVTFFEKGQRHTNGKVIYVFQPGEITRAEQFNFAGDFQIIPIIKDDTMPIQAKRSGFGELSEIIGNEPVYNSYISPMLPYLDKMARENSDLDAAVVRHLHPREWEVSSTECGRCKGTGQVSMPGGNVVCPKCKGSQVLKSPFSTLTVKQTSLGENAVPVPPAGIVERDTAIIEMQDKRVADHGANALASINMEFLADNPLNQSGVAKEIDRDELNNFVFGVAWNAINRQMIEVYTQNAEQRYLTIMRGNVQAVKDLLPTFTVPTKFDLLSENTSVDQLKKMIDSGVDQSIITERQQDLVEKLYRQEPNIRAKITLAFQLNPFPSLTGEDLENAMLAGTITKRDAILSQYVDTFITEAMQDDEEFLSKDLKTQKGVIDEKLTAKIAELNADAPQPPEPIRNGNGEEI